MIKESSYVTLCMDPMSSRIYFVSEDGRKSTKAPAGAKVRVPTDMKRMTSMSYHEKNVTVEVSTLPNICRNKHCTVSLSGQIAPP